MLVRCDYTPMAGWPHRILAQVSGQVRRRRMRASSGRRCPSAANGRRANSVVVAFDVEPIFIGQIPEVGIGGGQSVAE